MNNVVLLIVTFASGGPSLLYRVVPKTHRGFNKLVSIGREGVSSNEDIALMHDITTGKEVGSPADLKGYTHAINIAWY